MNRIAMEPTRITATLLPDFALLALIVLAFTGAAA
jgi:hypothetical protein